MESPHDNTIEMAFAKLKALLRKAAKRTVAALWDAIGFLIDAFTPPNAPTTLLMQATMQPERVPL